MRSQIIAALVALGIGTLAEAQENIVYDTSPSSGRVVSIRVEENAPPRLPAVEIPENATSEDIARAIEQLAAIKPSPSPSPSPVPSVSVTPRYGPRVRANDPVSTARDFMNVYGKAFGLSNPAKELVPLKEEKDSLGMSHIRFKQMYKNIPVFGAEMVAHVGADGKVKSINGKVGSGITVSTRTRVSASKAMTIAKKMFQSKYPGVRPTVKRPVLYVYQPSVFNTDNSINSYLSWEVRCYNADAWVDHSFIVDSSTGSVISSFDNIRGIKRKIYDCSAEPGTDVCWSNKYNPTFNYTFGCQEGLCPHGPNPRYLPEISTDTDDLYSAIAQIHDYFQLKFQRNGANGQGGNTDGTIFSPELEVGRTYTNYISGNGPNCTTAAYWPERGIGFCKGMTLPDIIGHEYSHGLTQRLQYKGESGALAENFSDLMGESFEYWLTGNSDWIDGLFIVNPEARNLADPPSSSWLNIGAYPDRYYSSLMYCGNEDHGGVHMNSTVPSKAGYLLSQGGSFNGCSVSSMGIAVVEKIWYRAATLYYESNASFNSAYIHLIQSCIDLYSRNSSECRELVKALQAVELDQPGNCADSGRLRQRPATCSCEDTDDWKGEGSYLSQATIPGTVSSSDGQYRDGCLSKKVLLENYCKDGKSKRAIVTCPNFCSERSCY